MAKIDKEYVTNMSYIISSPCTPDTSESYEYPQFLPRIGDEYQAEIPTPIFVESLHGTPSTIDGHQSVYHVGLPVPTTWVHETIGNSFNNSKFISSVSEFSSNKREIEGSAKLEASESGEHEDSDSVPKKIPIPYCLGGLWTDVEQAGFLLGLYIFGKNLVEVKKFLETKSMENLLEFYYGKFYKSSEYMTWSMCRKKRSKKCVHGQRMFTGFRQKEFLSRILPKVPPESQKAVLEVTKLFGDGKVNLCNFVSTLKATVGINLLIEAAGIGKGKHDITTLLAEPTKMDQVLSGSGIRFGKAFSSLTTSDIINFLTGDFRLSKARSNDLFWEAIWPRLLARGWHSEKSKSQERNSLKCSLMFLVPGIRLFKKNKLVKGTHYFDSVTDVLNKVASEPNLLEIEREGVNSRYPKEDFREKLDSGIEKNNFSDSQISFYLQPKLNNYRFDLVKFTVVDTSLSDGGVTELRSLPGSSTITHKYKSQLIESDGDDFLKNNRTDINMESNRVPGHQPLNCNLLECAVTMVEKVVSTHTAEPSITSDTKQEIQYHHVPNVKPCLNNIKCQFSRRRKFGENKLSFSPGKQLKLNACGLSKSSKYSEFKEEPQFLSKSREKGNITGTCFSDKINLNAPSESDLYLNYTSSTTTSVDAQLPCKSSQDAAFINPNPPLLLLNCETQNPPPMNVECQEHPVSETKHQTVDNSGAATKPRRQSKRNRPLTTKALEALEYEFLNVKCKPRETKSAQQKVPASKYSRRIRGRAGVSGQVITAIAHDDAIAGGNIEEQ